jgi:predicted nucleic acid-binding protein
VIVLDASAVIELLLGSKIGAAVQERIRTEDLAAPHLLDVEVLHVLRRFERAAMIANRRGQQALDDLRDLRVTRYPHPPLLPRMWQLRANLTGYDAAYVALAETFDIPLVTCDTKLAASPGHRARIEAVQARER